MISWFALSLRNRLSRNAASLISTTSLLTAAMLSSGCSVIIDGNVGAGVGSACEASSDCQGENAVCDATKTCTLPCAAAQDCPEGASCVETFCRQGGIAPLGAPCQTGTECESSICTDGLCVTPCSSTSECAGNAVCVDGNCQVKLVSGFVFDNAVSNAKEGFALSHEVGRKYAVAELPWLEAIPSEANTNDIVSASIEGLVGDGAEVVVVTTNRFETEALEKAKAYPDTRFLTFSTTSNGDNFTSYDVRIHQAWYIAGFVAGSFEPNGQVAFLGAVPIPEVIRQLNAFTLGVLKANPKGQVVVAWANDFVPPDDISRKLVDYLIATKSKVIANRLGTGVSVTYIEELHKKQEFKDIYSTALNNENACSFGPTSCLGSPYYNWGPLYVRLLDQIHRGTFDPTQLINESIVVDPLKSPFHFALNDAIAGLDGLKPDIVSEIGNLVGDNGEDRTFAGGFCVTDKDQRPGKPECSPKGEIVDDAELASMCWLVKGVKQPGDVEDPQSELVDARAPDGTILWPPKSVNPSSLTKPSCN